MKLVCQNKKCDGVGIGIWPRCCGEQMVPLSARIKSQKELREKLKSQKKLRDKFKSLESE